MGFPYASISPMNADVKVAFLAAGIAAGADSVDGMGVLRFGAVGTLLAGVRAQSTRGVVPAVPDPGNVRYFDKAPTAKRSRSPPAGSYAS